MNLFDRFHAAFEETPPRGAFERLQRELIEHSAGRAKRRPALAVRPNKMILRLAAAVAAVVIAIALVAGFLAIQRQTTAGIPAGSSENVAAYQSMIRADHDAFMNLPFRCQPITDPHCKSDRAANLAAVMKWQSDLQSFRTPPRFAIIDGQMRLHMQDVIVYMTAAGAAIDAGDGAGLARATNFGDNDLTWLDKMTTAITTTRVATSAQYTTLLQTEYDIGFKCSNCNDLTAVFTEFCPSIDNALCGHDVESALQGISQVQEDIVQNSAPTELAAKDVTLQHDLAQADDALMQMSMALFKIDAKALTSSRAAFLDATVAITSDLQS